MYLLFDDRGQVFRLDGISNTVEQNSTMNEARKDYCCDISPCRAYIYVFGGLSIHESTCLRTVERYTIEQNIWETVASLSCPLINSVAVTMPNGIYLLGGQRIAHNVSSQTSTNI